MAHNDLLGEVDTVEVTPDSPALRTMRRRTAPSPPARASTAGSASSSISRSAIDSSTFARPVSASPSLRPMSLHSRTPSPVAIWYKASRCASGKSPPAPRGATMAGKKFGRAGKIIPSLNGFVPKPNTPLQWDAICSEKELKRRIKYVCKGLSKIPNVDVRFMSSRIAHEQALFSSGDRTVARVIYRAAELGGDISRAIRELGIDPAFHISRDRSYDEYLPWSIVDSGLSFEFLKTEHEKAHAALSSLPCPAVEKCTTCGVCPSTWLADAPPALVQIQPARVRESLAAAV